MLKRLWDRLPVIVRAIIIGELVVSVGGLSPPLAIIANLRITPRVPWMIIATALWLSLLWWYLRGGGWPRQSAESRKRDLRGNSLPARVWGWALLAGTFGIASSLALGFATLRVAGVTREAFASPIKLSNYPMLTCDVRHCVDYRDGSCCGGSRVSRLHAFSDSTSPRLDRGYTDDRLRVLS
jgi:hypothetical protein